MASHIYLMTGEYEAAARSNQKAAAADRAYFKRTGAQGMYRMYYGHNLDFLRAAHTMQGRFQDARKAAEETAAVMRPFLALSPALQVATASPTLVLVRFRRWDEILRLPAPDRKSVRANAIRHYARAMAQAALGKVESAEQERAAFLAARRQIPVEEMWSLLHGAGRYLELIAADLDARIAVARGDRTSAIALWRRATEAQDALGYAEGGAGSLLYFPFRESLGGTLLQDGQHEAAASVFRADLERYPGNGRALFGLLESLKAQGKATDAQWVERAFQRAWSGADALLRVEDL